MIVLIPYCKKHYCNTITIADSYCNTVTIAGSYCNTITIAGSYCNTITIAGSYCNTITIAGSYCNTITIADSYCNTITIAGSYCNTIVITIGNIICLKKIKDFYKALVLMTSSVEVPFESHTVAVIFDELSTVMLAPKVLYIWEFWYANSNTFLLMVITYRYFLFIDLRFLFVHL